MLLFAAGQAVAMIADHGVVAVRKGSSLAGCDQFIGGRV
jgi:hypothetical protein